MEFWIIFLFVFAIETKSISQCPENLQYDPSTKDCIGCGTDKIYNASLRMCTDIVQICDKGFKYNLSERKCLDVDECNEKQDPCQLNQYCKNINGSFICIEKEYCGQGYEFDPVTKSCTDIDECKYDIHSCDSKSVCENIPGSFNCRPSCPIDKPYYRNFACHPCIEGLWWNPKLNKCIDLDECAPPISLRCEAYKEVCVTKPGLSVCEPHCSGGTQNVSGICYDIDECMENLHNCTSTQSCTNFFGTFSCNEIRCKKNEILNFQTKTCDCKPGFHLDLYSQMCEDIDECKEISNVCGKGECNNTIGHYECLCNYGYEIKNGTCSDINECRVFSGICGHLECENIPGQFKCGCPAGYKKTSQDICIDINECTEDPNICTIESNVINEKYQCFNLIGSFKCVKSECPVEYKTIKTTSYSNECQLNNTKCSYDQALGCVQQLPEKLHFQVIQIRDINFPPYQIGSIDLNGINFDYYYVKVNVRKAVNVNKKIELDLINSVILRNENENKRKLSIYIIERLSNSTEIVVDVFIKTRHEDWERIHSLYQFHIFAHLANE